MMTGPFHQATCIAIGGRGVLIEGPPGAGKSSLALTLLDRGAALVGDDGVLLEVQTGRLIARPHPRARGLIEVRNLGLIEWPALEEAEIALCVVLDKAAPRWIETPETTERGGVAIPLVRLWPGGDSLAIKTEIALTRFGLTPN